MRIFVIGGATLDREDPGAVEDLGRVTTVAHAIGREACLKRHDLVICSPFSDSADHAAFQGVVAAGTRDAIVEIGAQKQSQRGEERHEIRVLLARKADVKPLVVEVHDRVKVRREAVVKELERDRTSRDAPKYTQVIGH